MASKSSRSLRGIEIFRSLSDASLTILEGACAWRALAAGQRLIGHDDTSDEVFFVVEGSLRVVIYAPNGRPVLFRAMGPGDVIGEIAAIDRKPRSASVEAASRALVAQLDGAAFRALAASEPTVAMALLRQSIAYVRELSGRVYAFSSLAASNRIQSELLRIGREAARIGGEAVIEPAPRLADIAARISTHREAVSRELSRLARLGLVDRRGKALVILDLERLARLVDEASSA